MLEGQRPGLIVESPEMLTWKVRRDRFANRAGFDPLGGHELRTREDQLRIPEWIREQATVPVADFPQFIERVPRAK
jgi:hypothetical protein